MYHEHSKTWWGRTLLGDVHVIRFKQIPPPYPPKPGRSYADADQVEWDIRIPATVWATIVALVSHRGDKEGRYYEALGFHMGSRE